MSATDFMGNALPDLVDGTQSELHAWDQLRGTFAWFSRSAAQNRIKYQASWIATLVLGVGVTTTAASGGPAQLGAALGAAIVLVEGMQRGFHWSDHYYQYRGATEELRRAAMTFDGHLAPFDGPERDKALTTLVIDVLRSENKAWLAVHVQDAARRETPPAPEAIDGGDRRSAPTTPGTTQ